MAVSRVRFLTSGTVDPAGVRPQILASWRRSSDSGVVADRVPMVHRSDVPVDTPLHRSADAVLRRLATNLAGQPISVILTDPTGTVLSRMTGDRDFERTLDRINLAPGFNYAENLVGTNGIGTAIEVGGPAHVFGPEHYAENLEELACAAVPLHHPITGRLVGVVDLTCWRKDADALLLTFAKTTAEQISQALLTDAGAAHFGLLREYMRVCSRRVGVVFALGNEVTLLNESARTGLEPADQAALLAHAAETLTSPRRGTLTVDLPSGQTARLHCRPVLSDGRVIGVVGHTALEQPRRSTPDQLGRTQAPPLPGLVGTSPIWLHACQVVERAFRGGEWLALEGESGVGKLATLRAVQLRRQPVGRLVVVETADAGTDPTWLTSTRRAILEDADSVVIRHVERLDGLRLRGLAAALQEARAESRDRPLWAGVTMTQSAGTRAAELVSLLQMFPRTVEIPPLRMHLQDLLHLVPLFLSRSGSGSSPVLSPEAMRMLMRMSWPGNVEEVHQVLDEIALHRRTGIVEPDDLPASAHAVSRRVLSALESMERDAIVHGLADADGNKTLAAGSLGMSRATIYRKIREYGIVVAPAPRPGG